MVTRAEVYHKDALAVLAQVKVAVTVCMETIERLQDGNLQFYASESRSRALARMVAEVTALDLAAWASKANLAAYKGNAPPVVDD